MKNRIYTIFTRWIVPGVLGTLIIIGTLAGINVISENVIKPIQKKQELVNTIEELEKRVSDLRADEYRLSTNIGEMVDRQKHLSKQNSDLQKSFEDDRKMYYEMTEERLSTLNYLYERYGYSIRMKSSDMTVGQLLYLHDKCDDYGAEMDISMGVMELESSFNSASKNKKSTATGRGQFLRSTANGIAKKDMGMENYVHSRDAYNPYISMEMNVIYLSQLKREHGSYAKAVEWYYGSTNPSKRMAYVNVVSGKLKKRFGATVYDF